MPSDSEKLEQAILVEIAPGIKIDPREMTFSEICKRLGRESAAAARKGKRAVREKRSS